ncbi:MAG: electron transfer flavoprotein subunit beta/FixA family protein [Thermodesulfobacteriota bacterium]
MKILAPVKQVYEEIPLTEPEILKKNFSKNESDLGYKINRFDDHALEEALKLKESLKNTTVHTVTTGTDSASEILKKTIGKGADKAFHILTDSDTANDPGCVSEAVKHVFEQNNYDLIFFGMMSEDIMNSVTGAMTAAKLNIPFLSGITEIKEIKEKTIIVKSELEGGIKRTCEINLPCALSFQAGINKPGYPNVLKMLKADENTIVRINYDKLKSLAKNTEVKDLKLPLKTRKGEFIEGTSEEKVKAFIEILKKRKILQEK